MSEKIASGPGSTTASAEAETTSPETTTTTTKDNTAARQNIEAEYNKKLASGWHRYYKEICEKCDRAAKEQHFSTLESERSNNRSLNRYRDVNPYDHSRIVLQRGSVDYINANLVKLERADRKYILTQGPLAETVGHFWLMVWEQNTRAILMLNKLMENRQVKCHKYWPNHMGEQKGLQLNDVKLAVDLVRMETYQNFVRRWFKLTDLETQQSREVMQFHYTTWPDFGIPSSPDAFLKFLQQVRDSGALSKDVGPAVVHCSAGIGRSGTFCLVDCCLVLVDKHGEGNVAQVLCELRSYRMGLIQTADQLDFSYQAIIEGIKKLKDPTFLDMEEPIISNEADAQSLLDELPPPLPPRTHSLNPPLPLAPQKTPLPNGENVELLEDTVGDNNKLNKPLVLSKDALNNFINQHEIINAEVADSLLSNRPLPPLPSRPLNRVQESDSDNDDYDDDDDDDDNDDDDDEEEYENIDDDDIEPLNGDKAANADDDVNANNEKATAINAAEQHKVNGIDIGNQNATSPENELKRRKRNEYQASLEQKVKDIKRKQQESEDSQQAAKKRRSLLTYIAAGVVVGVICAYAYTKLG